MNQTPSDTNREILPATGPAEAEQPAAVESAALETGIGGGLPQILRPDTTPSLNVNCSSSQMEESEPPFR